MSSTDACGAPECEFIKLKITSGGNRNEGVVFSQEDLVEDGDQIFSGPSSNLACLQDILNSCGSDGTARSATGTPSGGAEYWESDDCVALHFKSNTNTFETPRTSDCGGGGILSSGNPCPTWVTYLMDTDCNIVNPDRKDPTKYLCSRLNLDILSSPISLIWDNDIEISDALSITSFPLRLNQSEKVYLWRASAKTPLLVYDPKHKGEVTSSTQLFGDWTFGGKGQLASINDAGLGAKNSWSNGYEALAVLDLDKDGVIQSEELEPIGLWFDENRDGISQVGEVISAKEAELKSLFYKNAATSKDSRDVTLELGFVREVDGKELSGKSVDWYGEEFSNTAEAINYIEAKSTLGKSSFSHTKEVSKISELEDFKDSTASRNGGFDGHWVWELNEQQIVGRTEDTVSPKGLIFLKEGINGKIFGTSYAEVQIKTNGVHRSLVKLSFIEGRVVSASEGKKPYLDLTITDEKGRETLTTARISYDGNVMSGESLIQLARGSSKKDLSSFKYSWTAKRPEIKR